MKVKSGHGAFENNGAMGHSIQADSPSINMARERESARRARRPDNAERQRERRDDPASLMVPTTSADIKHKPQQQVAAPCSGRYLPRAAYARR